MNGINNVSSSLNTPFSAAPQPSFNRPINQQSLITPDSGNSFAPSGLASSDLSSGMSKFGDGINRFFGNLLNTVGNTAGSFLQGFLSSGPIGGLISLAQRFIPGL
jgi:hypothetical protein